MLDLAHHLVTTTDLSVITPSTNIADLHSYINTDLIAQQFKQDVMGDIGKGWDSFVKSGQIWALLIGVVVGYLFRSITNS
ncbi:hypothetical protein [Pseudanabaena sp. Chao 1811]|uniref:hypothetical protein n=1 Tax=Pseudanabaena sp. Chao 1811 TaxID=2963092 RepID=UPI0022F3EB4A|nr:hypothetical protein [Pseudanabaena sp. Chao 1811]